MKRSRVGKRIKPNSQHTHMQAALPSANILPNLQFLSNIAAAYVAAGNVSHTHTPE